MSGPHQKTVLVVDDEAHIRHVVALKFRNAGFEVLMGADGEEGLALAREHHPDVIIVDLQMPFMNGVEMCTELARDEATSAIPAIMLTARGFGLTKEDTEQTIIKKMISKPFGPRQLLETATELIGTAHDIGGREAA